MTSTTKLTLVDGVRIIVPDSLNLITTYVLREQRDWFEDEIKFLRKLLQPGQRVIDIGASYGVYTLSMAKLVGPSGRVWAFEPASRTAHLLAASIAANGFSQVVLDRTALSAERGTAQLALNDYSELNALVHDHAVSGETEIVNVTTLDACFVAHDWQDIEFLKLDAEGEEANILRGGTNFFASVSPLVQYEVKAGIELHLELVQAFAELGYDSYRLVPGLNILAPFGEKEPVDDYLLNLFCCKPDRAASLMEHGFLTDATTARRCKEVQSNGEWGSLKAAQTNRWLATLMNFPYGKACADIWRKEMAWDSEVEAAFTCYVLSKNVSLTPAERFAALEESFLRLKALCETEPRHLRLSSLARVARDYGARSVAVKALSQLCNTILEQREADASEPFLAPGERFDSVPPRNVMANWVVASALEELERHVAFSSFYTGKSALQRLQIIRDLGFGSAEMNRRLNLVQQRFGKDNALADRADDPDYSQVGERHSSQHLPDP